MKLNKILNGIKYQGDIKDIDIKNISYDSRKISRGSLFVAIKAKCMIQLNPRRLSRSELYCDYKARLYFVKMANLSIVRMYIHYIVYITNSLRGKKL